jgi:3-deoxy-D-manno-octulosonic-acid transferase
VVFALYNAAFLPLYGLYRIVASVYPAARRFQTTRREGLAALRQFAAENPDPSPARRPIWLHASSAGELDQALGLAREIKRRAAGRPVLITVFSLSVRLRELPEADLLAYLPLDLPWIWARLCREIRPLAFATMTWDVFPNLLRALRASGAACYLCNAALPAKSWRLRPFWARTLRPIYALFDGVGAANEEHARRMRSLTPATIRTIATGDTRYDQIFYRLEHATLGPEDARRLRSFVGKSPTWILASTYAACDQEILPGLAALLAENEDWKALVFPHKIDEARLQETERAFATERLDWLRFSQYDPANRGAARILLVDRIGLLALAYGLGRFAYVGGAFHHRIHNTAEPAALGLPTLTGPRIDSSPIATELEAVGGLYRCKSGAEIIDRARDWMRQEKQMQAAGRAALAHLRHQRGASARFTDQFLAPLLRGRE